jgi:hypothetical protein
MYDKAEQNVLFNDQRPPTFTDEMDPLFEGA